MILCTGAAAVLAACAPALNWRDVTVDRLKVNLPCKPDRAQRAVTLEATTVVLDMAGCEASGALFAVSHARVPAGVSVQKMLEAWQNAAVENMQVQQGTQALAAYRQASGVDDASRIGSIPPMQAQGRKPSGEAVSAQWVWFAAGNDIYHLAIYAATVTPEMAEPLFTGAQIQ